MPKIYHHFTRSHQSLGGNDTTPDRAGIVIVENNKWKTIIWNASKDKYTNRLRENQLP